MVAGTLAGELSALSDSTRNATVVVEQSAVLWKLSSKNIRQLQLDEPELARTFVQLVLKGGVFFIIFGFEYWCIFDFFFFIAAKSDYDILLGAIASRQWKKIIYINQPSQHSYNVQRSAAEKKLIMTFLIWGNHFQGVKKLSTHHDIPITFSCNISCFGALAFWVVKIWTSRLPTSICYFHYLFFFKVILFYTFSTQTFLYIWIHLHCNSYMFTTHYTFHEPYVRFYKESSSLKDHAPACIKASQSKTSTSLALASRPAEWSA